MPLFHEHMMPMCLSEIARSEIVVRFFGVKPVERQPSRHRQRFETLDQNLTPIELAHSRESVLPRTSSNSAQEASMECQAPDKLIFGGIIDQLIGYGGWNCAMLQATSNVQRSGTPVGLVSAESNDCPES